MALTAGRAERFTNEYCPRKTHGSLGISLVRIHHAHVAAWGAAVLEAEFAF